MKGNVVRIKWQLSNYGHYVKLWQEKSAFGWLHMSKFQFCFYETVKDSGGIREFLKFQIVDPLQEC